MRHNNPNLLFALTHRDTISSPLSHSRQHFWRKIETNLNKFTEDDQISSETILRREVEGNFHIYPWKGKTEEEFVFLGTQSFIEHYNKNMSREPPPISMSTLDELSIDELINNQCSAINH